MTKQYKIEFSGYGCNGIINHQTGFVLIQGKGNESSFLLMFFFFSPKFFLFSFNFELKKKVAKQRRFSGSNGSSQLKFNEVPN